MRKPKSLPYFGEVAPIILHSHYRRRSSRFMKLETILEEEMQESISLCRAAHVSFPLLLSGLLYILMCRGVV